MFTRLEVYHCVEENESENSYFNSPGCIWRNNVSSYLAEIVWEHNYAVDCDDNISMIFRKWHLKLFGSNRG